MIDMQCKALNFTLGVGINRLKFTHYSEASWLIPLITPHKLPILYTVHYVIESTAYRKDILLKFQD